MNLLKSKRFYCLLALLAAPASLNALTDYFFNISGSGVIGSANQVSASGGSGLLAVGHNNYISYYASNTAVIGTGLNTDHSNSLVVGTWNQINDPNITGPTAFVVGNGGDSYSRQNALIVQTDGKVIIPGTANIGKVPARGGISMGNYNTGP